MTELHQEARSASPDQKTLPGLPPVPPVTGPVGSPLSVQDIPGLASLDSYISVSAAQALYRSLIASLWIASPSYLDLSVESRSKIVLRSVYLEMRQFLIDNDPDCNMHDLDVLFDRFRAFFGLLDVRDVKKNV